MEEPQIERRKMVTVPQEEFEAILERAAERGARHALSEVGLDGPEAARDISELRSLLDAFNEAKKTAGLTIVRMLVTGLVLATARRGVREAEGVRGWAVRNCKSSCVDWNAFIYRWRRRCRGPHTPIWKQESGTISLSSFTNINSMGLRLVFWQAHNKWNKCFVLQ
jgi:hypothetical protein